MKGKYLFYLFGVSLILASMLIFILPFIYAANIQDSIQQQLAQNQIIYNQENMKEISPGDFLIKAIESDPQLRATFVKLIIFIIIFAILMIIDLILKGIAMWKASKRNQKAWFWFLLIINSLGILPIIYLIIYRGRKEGKKKR